MLNLTKRIVFGGFEDCIVKFVCLIIFHNINAVIMCKIIFVKLNKRQRRCVVWAFGG